MEHRQCTLYGTQTVYSIWSTLRLGHKPNSFFTLFYFPTAKTWKLNWRDTLNRYTQPHLNCRVAALQRSTVIELFPTYLLKTPVGIQQCLGPRWHIVRMWHPLWYRGCRCPPPPPPPQGWGCCRQGRGPWWGWSWMCHTESRRHSVGSHSPWLLVHKWMYNNNNTIYLYSTRINGIALRRFI